jgi:hypothetical protein
MTDDWRWPTAVDRREQARYAELPGLIDQGKAPSPAEWARRRRTLIDEFSELVFGYTPTTGRLADLVLLSRQEILGGRGVDSQWLMTVQGPRGTLDVPVRVMTPAAQESRPVPLFLGMNITGNAGVGALPGIQMESWMPVAWPIRTILERGYAIGTLLNDSIEPDVAGGAWSGVRGLFDDFDSLRFQDATQWGALGAWAWGLSCAREAVASVPGVDGARVVVHGHSRLGMAALWAAAQDEAFAGAVSSQSGLGGASLARHRQGEDIAFASSHFPWWFCGNYASYAGRDAQLPVDQHQLLALLAPRPLHVGSADRDRHADPEGEFLATLHASPVYELFGHSGTLPANFPRKHFDVLPSEALSVPWPRLDERMGARLSYHVREGGHGVIEKDWLMYLDFARANGI